MSESEVDPGQSPSGYPLASRANRILAALIDGFVIAIIMMLVLNITGGADPIVEFSQLSAAERATHEVASAGFALKMLLLQAVVFLAINLSLLQKYGQTIGKRVMKIAIVDSTGQVPSLFNLLVMRYFSQVVMGIIPGIGVLLRMVDVSMIYRADRRCLHDVLAGTHVIDVRVPRASDNSHLVV